MRRLEPNHAYSLVWLDPVVSCGVRQLCVTNPPFAPAAIADAAFARTCGTFLVAAQRKAPKQSFQGFDLARTETELSPQSDPTTQTRTKRPYDFALRRAAFLGRSGTLHRFET